MRQKTEAVAVCRLQTRTRYHTLPSGLRPKAAIPAIRTALNETDVRDCHAE